MTPPGGRGGRKAFCRRTRLFSTKKNTDKMEIQKTTYPHEERKKGYSRQN